MGAFVMFPSEAAGKRGEDSSENESRSSSRACPLGSPFRPYLGVHSSTPQGEGCAAQTPRPLPGGAVHVWVTVPWLPDACCLPASSHVTRLAAYLCDKSQEM